MVKEEFKYKGHCHGLPLEQKNSDMANLSDMSAVPSQVNLEGWSIGLATSEYIEALRQQDALEKQLAPQYDPVERPAHYVQGPMEVIDIIEKYGFCDDFRLGNCIKYLFRHNLKGTALQDLKKARWYLDRYINALEKVEAKG